MHLTAHFSPLLIVVIASALTASGLEKDQSSTSSSRPSEPLITHKEFKCDSHALPKKGPRRHIQLCCWPSPSTVNHRCFDCMRLSFFSPTRLEIVTRTDVHQKKITGLNTAPLYNIRSNSVALENSERDMLRNVDNQLHCSDPHNLYCCAQQVGFDTTLDGFGVDCQPVTTYQTNRPRRKLHFPIRTKQRVEPFFPHGSQLPKKSSGESNLLPPIPNAVRELINQWL